MKFIISGKNITVTEGLKTAVQDKLSKLERYFTPDTEVVVTLSVEKERQKIEVTIPVKGNIIRSEQVSNDMYVSIDLVEEVIERQLRKYKNKIVDKQQAAANFQKAYLDKDYEEDEEVKIIRTKKFGIKPARIDETFAGFPLEGKVEFFLWQWKHLEDNLGKNVMSKVKYRDQQAIRFETPEEVDEAYLKLKGEGVEFITEPADYEWNAHCVYFVDVSGHMWELYCWTGAVPLGDLESKKNIG